MADNRRTMLNIKEPNVSRTTERALQRVAKLLWEAYDMGIPWVPFTWTTDHQLADGQAIFVDTSGGSVTLTLPSATGFSAGRSIMIKKITSDSNAIVVDTTGSETVEGGASVSFGISGSDKKQCRRFMSDGSNWWITGTYTP